MAGYSPCQSDSTTIAISNNDSVFCPTWYDMFTNIPGNCLDYCKITFATNKIPLYAGVAVLTSGLILTDDKTWQASKKFYTSSGRVKAWSDFFVDIGDGSSQFGLAGVFGLYGLITSDKVALRTASQITQTVLASGAVVQILKHITGRQSPFLATRPGGRWDFFPNQIQYLKHVPAYDAFPSGHLTTTLATVIVVAENYPNVKWIKPVGYTLSGLLAISMVNTGIHWYSDYPLAVVLGYTFGMLAAHPEGIPDYLLGKVGNQIQISPSIVNNGFGFGLYYSLN
jgi:membrane-associated phospholipid phosphatase